MAAAVGDVRADVLLSDGSVGVVRAVSPDDGPALLALHRGLSAESVRLRFFVASTLAATQYVEHVLEDPHTIALVAERHGSVIGLATAEPIDRTTCDIALLVADDAHGLGVGTLLLEHLAAAAVGRGITHFRAEVLADNALMLKVLADAGYATTSARDRGVVMIDLATVPTESTSASSDAREFAAEAKSLEPLLSPRSVAVVGVRSDGSGVGAAVVRSITAGGFRGAVSVVHPVAERLEGVAAYPSLSRVPAPLDLVVICVPAEAADGVLVDAAEAGAGAAVVISSGFGELGTNGQEMQHRLGRTARTHGIRVVGPNCLGLLVNRADVRLNATFSESVPPPGGLAVASQSGGVGIVLLDRARELGLGVHSFVSLGNKVDVSSNDLLGAWYDDPEVTAAALYLESFGNAAKFARVARRFSERKPLLAVMGGRSGAGRRAGASHTAAAATPSVGVDALFAQAGVIACPDAEDLARTALLLKEQPLPAGRRVAVVSNAGGMGVLAADDAAAAGLEVPPFSAQLCERLRPLVLGTAGTSNPVDAGAGVAPEALGGILDLVLGSGEVDAALVVPVATGVTDTAGILAELARVRPRHPQLPVLAVPGGGLVLEPDDSTPTITSFHTSASASRALARAARYAEWLAVPRTPAPALQPERAVAARGVARTLRGEEPEGRWLSPEEAGNLLLRYGIGSVGRTATTADEAVELAEEYGWPVVLKVADPAVVHKTDRGLVRAGLRVAREVRGAYEEFTDELGREAEVLVQPVCSGVEIALGMVRDPALGPLVMVAAGGVATDVWDDRVLVVPPVSESDAARAVRGLRVWPLLSGFRGAPAADTAGLERLLVAVGCLAEEVPEVLELDLNPVLVDTGDTHVVDVKLRLGQPRGPMGDLPRQLRTVP